MAEYIEREAAIAAIMSEPPDAHYPQWYADKIKAIPAADVAPVRYGRWIKEPDGGTRCSVCNKQVRDVTGGGDAPVDPSNMPYCPKCGAMMDLEV